MKRAIRQLMLPTALIVLALLLPAQAAHASVLGVQQDCADSDTFEREHSRADLQDTLKQIQGDVDEYTDCEKMVLAALASSKGNGGGPGGPGSGVIDADLNDDGIVTPKEKRVAKQRAKQQREQRDRQIAAVDEDLIQDDAAVSSSGGGSDSGGTPLPLILALVALGCAGIGGGLWYASKRNPAVANAFRRVPLPFRNS
jgi:hypothetical protein